MARVQQVPEVVKNIGAVAPYIDRAIFAQAFIVEAIHLQVMVLVCDESYRKKARLQQVQS